MVGLRIETRRLPALILLPLLLCGGLIGPALDAGLFNDGPTLEAKHHPSTCVVGHDHTICSQFGANRWLPARPGVPWLSLHREARPVSAKHRVLTVRRQEGSSRPRAPPAA